MENYMNIGLYNGPLSECDGTKFPYPFLSMIDKYDRFKNIGGNEFILLKRG